MRLELGGVGAGPCRTAAACPERLALGSWRFWRAVLACSCTSWRRSETDRIRDGPGPEAQPAKPQGGRRYSAAGVLERARKRERVAAPPPASRAV